MQTTINDLNSTQKNQVVYQTTITSMVTCKILSEKRSIQYGINVDALENNVKLLFKLFEIYFIYFFNFKKVNKFFQTKSYTVKNFGWMKLKAFKIIKFN